MKLLKKLLLALGLAGLFALTGAPALAADDDLAAIQKAGVIRIGTEGTYAPFTFHETSDNKLVGFDVDIGRAIAAKLGVKPEFVEGKWDGLIAGLNVNRYDVVINQVGISAERQAKYDFSRPYIASAAALIVYHVMRAIARARGTSQEAASPASAPAGDDLVAHDRDHDGERWASRAARPGTTAELPAGD